MGLEVLANALKAAINADLSANTGALRWQGAMSHRLEVGVGLENRSRAGPASLEWARYGARSIPRGPRSIVTHSKSQDFGRSESYSRRSFSSHVIHRPASRGERSRRPPCAPHESRVAALRWMWLPWQTRVIAPNAHASNQNDVLPYKASKLSRLFNLCYEGATRWIVRVWGRQVSSLLLSYI